MKDLEVPWGCNSAILIRNEITSLSLYHIWKILYQRNLPKWCSPFDGTPVDGLFSKNIEIPKRCVFFGVWRAKSSATELAVLRELQTWYKPKWKIFIGNTFSGISGITNFFVRVCKDPLNCPGNGKHCWKSLFFDCQVQLLLHTSLLCAHSFLET